VKNKAVQTPGARPPGRLNLVPWRLIFLSSNYGTGVTATLRRLEFLVGSWFVESVCTPLQNVCTSLQNVCTPLRKVCTPMQNVLTPRQNVCMCHTSAECVHTSTVCMYTSTEYVYTSTDCVYICTECVYTCTQCLLIQYKPCHKYERNTNICYISKK